MLFNPSTVGNYITRQANTSFGRQNLRFSGEDHTAFINYYYQKKNNAPVFTIDTLARRYNSDNGFEGDKKLTTEKAQELLHKYESKIAFNFLTLRSQCLDSSNPDCPKTLRGIFDHYQKNALPENKIPCFEAAQVWEREEIR